MATQTNNSSPSVGFISVSLGRTSSEAIEQFVQNAGWQVLSASFDAYISAERRVSIPPQMKAIDLRIAFVDYDRDADAAAESTRHLKQLFHGDITVIAIAERRDPEFLITAMRAGCGEFLQKPLASTALTEVLTKVGSSSGIAEPARDAGTILSFFGVKGGVGTTMIAVHLAVYLTQCHNKKTLLIDNHTELGHACLYLGLDGSRFNFQEVMQNVNRLDSELLKGYVAKHSTGLDVLSSPEVCMAAASKDPASMAHTLDFLRGEYDFVLVDSSIGTDDTSLTLMENSAESYLVASPDIASLRDLARYLEAFGQTEEIEKKLKLVLNRFSSTSAISLEQIESAIGRPINIKLPNSQVELQQVANLGQTLSPKMKSEFGKKIEGWAAGLAGPAPRRPLATKLKKPTFFRWTPADEIAH
ncbi:AAA family ATPase [Granulicella paludicola]|uniref:AAA family ATPase n=1 Tax=Granulicella paludicola TaxID=474951 RepID=UPI0021E070CC|nr:AAA family ATPase [Granulicella paludicola]